MPPVDLVVVFRSATSKQDVQEVADEYGRLISLLKAASLDVAGKKGSKQGQILICVHCPNSSVLDLARKEARRDLIHGFASSNSGLTTDISPSAADRLRLIHSYICSSKADGGLGIVPLATEWNHVESIMAVHDTEWNHIWLKSWAVSFDISTHLDSLREQFGESLALYFEFLAFYTKSLIIPAVLGILSFLSGSFNAIYSFSLLLWSVSFVECWRIHEVNISSRWGVSNVSTLEKIRAEYVPHGDVWWKREMKIIASLPVIAVFASILFSIMTSIFVLEAFIIKLYTGPGRQYISLIPTVLFVVVIPRFLAFYQKYAIRLTHWENHRHASSYDRSLTLKTFALGAIVAYGGLALTTFVYIPFGDEIMLFIQSYLSGSLTSEGASTFLKVDPTGSEGVRLIEALKGERLKNQVFAYTVTNQIINAIQEVAIPLVLKGAQGFKNGKLASISGYAVPAKKKRVEWEDEKNASGMNKEDRRTLEDIRGEAALPEYHIFSDFAEMVTQFGYVVLWSACWPLAPVMALLNNWVEIRSDAFKVANLGRRPLPSRTESIGPWLESLSFIAWLGALVNAALLYLFNPKWGVLVAETGLASPANLAEATIVNDTQTESRPIPDSNSSIMLTTLLIALTSSHLFLILRVAVRHVLRRIVRTTTVEHEGTTQVPGASLAGVEDSVRISSDPRLEGEFWEDQGMTEILSKTE